MKHSAMVAAKSEIDMEEAKKVNKILRQCWEMPKLQGLEVEIPKTILSKNQVLIFF